MDCIKCGSAMAFRTGRWGNFWGCTNFPRCKNTIAIKGSGKVIAKKEVEQPDSVALVAGSDQQEKIWDFMQNGTGHAVVHACPGTGKTFSTVQGCARLDTSKQSVIYFAFNKNIRDEMLTKAPKGVTVRGLNQFGHQIVTKAFKGAKFDDNKYYKMYNSMFPASTPEETKVQIYGAFKAKELVNLCQSYHLDGTNEDELFEIINRHEVRLPVVLSKKIVNAIPLLLEEGKKAKVVNEKTVFSFTYGDQLWLPVVLDLPTPQYDMICIDEAQDLNVIQHHLVMKAMHANTRVIVVGDENQAIYAFRGADADSMRTMADLLISNGGTVSHFPLTKTFRCGKKIVDVAKQFVPEIEANDTNPDGEVSNVNLQESLEELDNGDMVLCRMNAPLVKLGYKLMRKHKKVRFVGKPFGEQIVGLVEGLEPKDITDLHSKLNAYEDKEMKKLEEKKLKGDKIEIKMADLSDKMDCIRVFLSNYELNNFISCTDGSVSDLLKALRDFYLSDTFDADAITLSSIHRAKGTERDRVFYLMPDIGFKELTPEEEKQEQNLKFVAVTRAKHHLFFLNTTKEELGQLDQERINLIEDRQSMEEDGMEIGLANVM